VAVTKDMLLSELQDLLRLTAFEQTIATVRRSQAASTPIAEELKANAEKSGERRQLLADAVRQLGGVPDVVGAALSKVGALAQTQLNQVQTLQGALLGDLALEHSLRERTRYARTLAESLGQRQVLPVLERLEVAHTATIECSRRGSRRSAAPAPRPQGHPGAVRRHGRPPYGRRAPRPARRRRQPGQQPAGPHRDRRRPHRCRRSGQRCNDGRQHDGRGRGHRRRRGHRPGGLGSGGHR
jgi:bacterioferritin (cytochrome b1)